MAQERNANAKLSDYERGLLVSEMFTMALTEEKGGI